MKLSDIPEYIESGLIESKKFDGVIEIPEQTGRRILCFDSSHAFRREDLNGIIGVKIMNMPSMFGGIDAAVYMKEKCPFAPYLFRDEQGSRWTVKGKTREFRNLDHPKQTTFLKGIVIDFKEELREIIRHWKPKETKRSDKVLGKIYRYNKLLIENGFSPEEFEVVKERGDLLNMLDLENLTLGEIRRNYNTPGAIFERDGEEWLVDTEGRLVNPKNGKEARWELGWKVVLWNTTEFPKRH